MIVLLAALALVTAFLVTPVVRNLSLNANVLDQPDSFRKRHPHPIPRLGGVAVMFAYVLAFLLSSYVLTPEQQTQITKPAIALLPAVSLVFLVGLFDDIFSLKALPKLGGQLAASVVAYSLGIRLTQIGSFQLPDWSSFLLTVGWLVFCTNAFNLIDGLDGLAGGVGLSVTLTILIVALIHGNIPLVLATAPLAGALLGFLPYNFNPASIFLGDSGSLTIGFMLGAFSLFWSQKATTLLGISAPLTAMALPIADSALAIFRRWAGGTPMFEGDRRHIHHRLLDFGLKPWQASLLLYAATFASALFAIGQSLIGPHPASWLLFGLHAALVVIGVRALGYAEFAVLSSFLNVNRFRSRVQANAELQQIIHRIENAANPDECWHSLSEYLVEMGAVRVDLIVGGRRLSAGPGTLSADDTVQIQIPLGGRNTLTIMSASIDAAQVWLNEELIRVLQSGMDVPATAQSDLAFSRGAA